MFVRIDRFPTERFQELNQSLGDFVSELVSVDSNARAMYTPSVDINEYANEYIVVAELPGVKKEDVKLTVENGTLTLSGERKIAETSYDGKNIPGEAQSRKFHRVIRLAKNVDVSNISAELQNGILQIKLPKSAEAQAREINIK